MACEEDLTAIMQASFLYHELFRNTQINTLPDRSLTKTQIDIMVALLIGGPQHMSSIGNRLRLAREQVTRAMNGLREGEYVISARDPENRRMVIATLTEKGHDLLDEHLQISRQCTARYLDALSEEDWATLADASRNAKKVLDKLCKPSYSAD